MIRTFYPCLILGLILALAGCDTEGVPAKTHDERADVFVKALAEDLEHRTLVGYGGRQFEVVFEAELSSDQSEDQGRWTISIPHWQEQKDAAMYYTLEIQLQQTTEGWELSEATLLYHGTRDAEGYEEAPGYKPIDVLIDTKGNVYAKPLRRAFRVAFE